MRLNHLVGQTRMFDTPALCRDSSLLFWGPTAERQAEALIQDLLKQRVEYKWWKNFCSLNASKPKKELSNSSNFGLFLCVFTLPFNFCVTVTPPVCVFTWHALAWLHHHWSIKSQHTCLFCDQRVSITWHRFSAHLRPKFTTAVLCSKANMTKACGCQVKWIRRWIFNVLT